MQRMDGRRGSWLNLAESKLAALSGQGPTAAYPPSWRTRRNTYNARRPNTSADTGASEWHQATLVISSLREGSIAPDSRAMKRTRAFSGPVMTPFLPT